jgi:hypothetical protein
MALAQPKWGPNWARRPVRLLEGLLTSRYGWTPFGLILAFYVAVQIHDGGSDLRRWDVLLISGWAVLVVGLVIAQTVPQRAQRMRDRGSLEVTQRELDELWTDFSAGAGRWGLRTGWVTAAAVFLAFVLATRGNLALKATLVVLESLGAYVAGFHLGRMAGFGRLGALPARQGVHAQGATRPPRRRGRPQARRRLLFLPGDGRDDSRCLHHRVVGPHRPGLEPPPLRPLEDLLPRPACGRCRDRDAGLRRAPLGIPPGDGEPEGKASRKPTTPPWRSPRSRPSSSTVPAPRTRASKSASPPGRSATGPSRRCPPGRWTPPHGGASG